MHCIASLHVTSSCVSICVRRRGEELRSIKYFPIHVLFIQDIPIPHIIHSSISTIPMNTLSHSICILQDLCRRAKQKAHHAQEWNERRAGATLEIKNINMSLFLFLCCWRQRFHEMCALRRGSIWLATTYNMHTLIDTVCYLVGLIGRRAIIEHFP